MKDFSFLVRVPVTYSPEQVKAANVKWNALIEQWKQDGIYITSFPFPAEGYVISSSNQAEKKSVFSDNLRVVSNIFLRADSMEDAVELAKQFPVLEYGGTVEVREIQVRPQT
ncbi:hypothetical protein OCK74_27635 [Chitinophagaceae bacterium LB-8]|uniref:YCII-related domain-containing protein n=1 Tax=Paraflavisolibacter caeni TaxID=2982496 RepID=A0A9X3BJI6_9BACT|nr:hypothetical protein [Paraflavisolibacter caeni]MCU7552922.1 hypothetical protein [Paraflavisolibacter caeni]